MPRLDDAPPIEPLVDPLPPAPDEGEDYLADAGRDHLVVSAAGSEPLGRVEHALFTLRRRLFGRRLASDEEEGERLSKRLALPVFSSDAISSSAYASEEILLVLASGGAALLAFGPVVAAAVALLLGLIAISYRQVCYGFPKGGGAYAVASSTLGTKPALVAAASLIVDYILTAAVSTAAGVAAITSAFPVLAPLRVELALGALGLLALLNLRGLRESGRIFAIPTYAFVTGALALVATGLVRIVAGDPAVTWSAGAVPAGEPTDLLLPLLLLKAFAYGAVALTGTEAISDGVAAFKAPAAKNAATTMTVMAALLGVIFVGISTLAFAFGKLPLPVGSETLLSQVARAVFGDNALYVAFQAATAGILLLAANTGFNGGPQLARILARDGFLPRAVGQKSDRLAYGVGIVLLATFAACFLLATGAVVTLLIPAYAIGVFAGFTISQAGMVVHWRRLRSPGWRGKALLNGTGAAVTATVFTVISIAKFAAGGWIIFLLVPAVALLMWSVRRRYDRHERELAVTPGAVFDRPHRPRRIVAPFGRIDRSTVRSMTLGRILAGTTGELIAVRVVFADEDRVAIRAAFERAFPGIRLITVDSPYRAIVEPLVHLLGELEAEDAELPPSRRRMNVVLVPEYAGRHWWDRLLHDENGRRIRAALIGRRNTVVVDLPYRRRME